MPNFSDSLLSMLIVFIFTFVSASICVKNLTYKHVPIYFAQLKCQYTQPPVCEQLLK
jgi:hypothetical protein